MEYYSAIKKRNKIVPFAETWMDLQTVIWSEVSQKEKNKYHILALEKEMAAHSSNLAWRIPWSEQTGGLQSMGLQERATKPILTRIYGTYLPSPETSHQRFFHIR